MSAQHMPDPYAPHRVAVRQEYRACTPFRLGVSVGRAGEDLPSPYGPGSQGDRNYSEGLTTGRRLRTEAIKAAAIAKATTGSAA